MLTVGYDLKNLSDPERRRLYRGPVERDHYGREIPRAAHGSINLGHFTASTRELLEAATALFDQIVEPNLLVRRMYVVANHIYPEGQAPEPEAEQLDLFSTAEAKTAPEEDPQRERRRQEAILRIREKYGKNAILRGMNLEEGATARDRNQQIGGHRA